MLREKVCSIFGARRVSGHGAYADRAPQKNISGLSDGTEHDSRPSGIFHRPFSATSEGMPAHAGKTWISSRLFGCSVRGAGGGAGHGAYADHAPQKKMHGRTDSGNDAPHYF